MKSLLIALTFSFASLTVNAGNTVPDLNATASEIARKLANQIELNEMEYIQVRNYTLEKLELQTAIKDLYAANQEMMEAKLSEVEKSYEFRIQNLLSNKQFYNYLSLNNLAKSPLNFIATTGE